VHLQVANWTKDIEEALSLDMLEAGEASRVAGAIGRMRVPQHSAVVLHGCRTLGLCCAAHFQEAGQGNACAYLQADEEQIQPNWRRAEIGFALVVANSQERHVRGMHSFAH
jgi:hypothetical protein